MCVLFYTIFFSNLLLNILEKKSDYVESFLPAVVHTTRVCQAVVKVNGRKDLHSFFSVFTIHVLNVNVAQF